LHHVPPIAARPAVILLSQGLPAAVDILLTLDVLLTLVTVAAPVDFRRPGARSLLLLLPGISPPFLCFATLGLRWRPAFSSLLPSALLFDSLLLTLLLSESRTVYRPWLMRTLTVVLTAFSVFRYARAAVVTVLPDLLSSLFPSPLLLPGSRALLFPGLLPSPLLAFA
jgi:hypothetical protein